MAKIYLNYVTNYGDAPSQVSVDITNGASFTFTEDYLPTLTVDGYQFEGWMLAGAVISAGYVLEEIDDDIVFTLIAKWIKESNVYGNASGGFGFPKTYILTDENGNEFTGVYVESETIFTATDNDVRENVVYAGDRGKSVGTKIIPSYNSSEGTKVILAGKPFTIELKSDLDLHNYTKLQVLICAYNKSMNKSVATEKVSINGKVYAVNSVDELATVTVDNPTQTIRLGVTNETDTPYIIRYFTYKEIY